MRTKKLRLFAIIFVLIIAFAICLTACGNTNRGELSIDNLNKRIDDTISAQDYYINKTVYTVVDGGKSGTKQNRDYFTVKSSTSNDTDRIYFFQDAWRYNLEDNIAVGTNIGRELWWSKTYDKIADKEKKDESLKKNMAVWRTFEGKEKLENGKRVSIDDKKNPYVQVAESREAQRNEVMNDMLTDYKVDSVLAPFKDLFSNQDNYELIDSYSQGSLDFYEIKVNENYNGGIGDREADADLLNVYHLSELGTMTFTVINTEDYARLTSITNLDDKESAIFYEMYFYYAEPPISVLDCAEEYVQSINDPQPKEIDHTLMYIIIGLACGLGIPLVSLLVWFIVRKARMFKDFDAETMELDEYIEEYKCKKKGIPYVKKEKEDIENAISEDVENVVSEDVEKTIDETVNVDENVDEEIEKTIDAETEGE